ncbi:transcriptional regulator [Candidatus Poribacteria bacterium]|nr:transcriptional regulator [Candidatus Poribacteria bacterium]
MRKYRKWRDILIEQLAADPTAAIGFLQAVMEDYQVFRNSAAVVSAVQAVIESQGGVAEIAKRTAIAPETLSKILSSKEAPHLDTFVTILKALGCRLSIEPLTEEDTQPNIELAAEQESPQLDNLQTHLSEPHSSQ